VALSEPVSFLNRLRADRRTQLLLARYLAIGGFVFCINYAVLRGLLHAHAETRLAAGLAFVASLLVHFTLNRFLNFRNFQRTIVQQAGTYAAVAAICGLVQITVVPLGLRLGLSQLFALALAVGLNVPIGFLGHRYLTFGHGIAGTIRRMRA
jgi:putative flippase GtrA